MSCLELALVWRGCTQSPIISLSLCQALFHVGVNVAFHDILIVLQCNTNATFGMPVCGYCGLNLNK